MISLNTQQQLPGSALGYLLTVRGVVGAALIVLGVYVLSLGSIAGTTTVNGVSSPATFSSFWPAMLLFALGVLLPLTGVLWYYTFSYMVADQNITINSGIVFRRSKVIDFNKVQNVDNVRGPLQMLFGLTTVNIWTASPDQIQISTVRVQGRLQTNVSKRPEGKLYLTQQDAEELKNTIATKGTVQNVNIVAPQTAPPQV